MKTAQLMAAAAFAIASLSVSAQAETPAQDIRCLILGNLFSKAAPDPQGRESAAQTRLFYLGRVSATVPPAQLATMMATQAKSIDMAQVGPEMNKCLASVQSSAAAVEAAGAKVKAAAGN